MLCSPLRDRPLCAACGFKYTAVSWLLGLSLLRVGLCVGSLLIQALALGVLVTLMSPGRERPLVGQHGALKEYLC